MRAFIALAIILASMATIAQARDLNLLCKSELTDRNGNQTDYLRQYQVNTETGHIAVYDDYGDGKSFQYVLSTKAVRLDQLVIVIVQRNGLYHEINRVTGMSFSRNAEGELRRGICSPSR